MHQSIYLTIILIKIYANKIKIITRCKKKYRNKLIIKINGHKKIFIIAKIYIKY